MARTLGTGVVLLALVGGGLVSGGVAPAEAAPATSTTLALDTSSSAYGRTVRATASVASAEGPAQGDVVFAVDGVEIKANLTGGGRASILLPRSEVGSHAVTATFVPQFPDQQEGSSAPAQVWEVFRVAVDVDLRVSGARPRSVARVHLTLSGDYGKGVTLADVGKTQADLK
jgi:hypothetical protein